MIGLLPPVTGFRLVRNHPLAKNLQAAYLFDRNGVNLVNPGQDIWALTGNGIFIPVSPSGPALAGGFATGAYCGGLINGQSGGSATTTAALRPTRSVTLMWRGYFPGVDTPVAGDPENFIVGGTHSNTGATPFYTYGIIRNGDSVEFVWNNGASNRQGSVYNISLSTRYGTIIQLTLVINSLTTSTGLASHYDGAKLLGTNSNVGTINYGVVRFCMARNPTNNSTYANSNASMLYIWDRALSQPEVTALWAAPYTFFDAPSSLVIFAGGVGTFTPISDGDTATATDAGESIASALTDDDPAAGVDAGESIAAGLTDAENAVIADLEASLVAGLTDSDTGTIVDGGEVVNLPVTDADTGASSDAGESLAVTLTDAEVGSGVDAGEALAVASTDTDSGTVADAVGSIALTDPDSGGMIDGEAIAGSITDADTATAVDTESLDMGTGTVSKSDDDPATVVDAGETIAAALTDAETASGVDINLTLAAGLIDTEAAVGLDAEATLAAGVTDTDTSTAVDTEGLGTTLTDGDVGSVAEAAVSVALAAAETGTLTDAELTLAVALTDSDTATWIELESLAVALSAADTAIADDAVGFLAVFRSDADFAVVVETELVEVLTIAGLEIMLGRVLPGWRLVTVGRGTELKKVILELRTRPNWEG